MKADVYEIYNYLNKFLTCFRVHVTPKHKFLRKKKPSYVLRQKLLKNFEQKAFQNFPRLSPDSHLYLCRIIMSAKSCHQVLIDLRQIYRKRRGWRTEYITEVIGQRETKSHLNLCQLGL